MQTTEETTVTRTKEKVRNLTAQDLGLDGIATKKKRRSLGEMAVAGDLIVALGSKDPTDERWVVAIEQVLEGVSGQDVIDRWKDQGVGTGYELWESRPGGHYRKRKS